MGRLLLTAGVLVTYVALHALTCVGHHGPPSAGDSVGVAHEVTLTASEVREHDHPVDDCGNGAVPHVSTHPQCLAAPRAADSGGLALFALPLLTPASLSSAGGLWRAPPPGRGAPPDASRSGREILHALCVLRH